jgi:4-nitrophenyl phosphatase/NagD protein
MTNRLTSTRCFLLDMDGTFYLGEHLLPGALEFIQYLRQIGLDFLFLTNNSSRSRDEYVVKLKRFGLELPAEKIFTSGEATTIYLSQHLKRKRIYLVGTPALEQDFIRQGFELTHRDPEAVVLGFDTTLTYAKIWQLCDLIVAGLPYIATHPDVNCPTETGFMPDIGAMIEMIAASTGKRPDVIIGKPYAPIIDALSQKLVLPIDQLCMVGDRLYTDIALGKTGCATVLVLSGETRREDLQASPFQPDIIVENLAHLMAMLQQGAGV